MRLTSNVTVYKPQKLGEAALINGGKLVEIIDVTDSAKRTVKVLDSHGNVKAVIANDTVTL